MTRTSNDAIDRREALRRAALLLGGALSASTVAGVLAGCEARRIPDDTWRPRALTADQVDLVATIAEHILPETDTPGARAALVHRFIDAMLAESYATEERQRFLAGLAEVDSRAQRACGRPFLRCGPAGQRTLLEQLDREAFAPGSGPRETPGLRPGSETASPPLRLPVTPGSRPGLETDPVPFFRTMKELTL